MTVGLHLLLAEAPSRAELYRYPADLSRRAILIPGVWSKPEVYSVVSLFEDLSDDVGAEYHPHVVYDSVSSHPLLEVEHIYAS